MSNAPSPFPKKNLSLSRCPVFFFSSTVLGSRLVRVVFWTTDPLIQADYRAVVYPVEFSPWWKKKRDNTEFEASAYWSYMLSPAVISFFLVFEALSKLLNWIWFIFFCYRDISRLATKCGYWDDIFQPVYMKSAEPLRHVFTCPVAPETRGLKLVHAFFFGLFSMLRKLQYTRMFVYISGTGLCRPLGDNNLSVLPFSIFQQLTSLTQL